MTKALRTVVVAVAACAALAFAGTAFAAFTPRLVVSHAQPLTGTSVQTTISITASQTDNSIAKITIAAPLGYTAKLDQPAGAQLGTVLARAYSSALSGVITIKGNVVVANPSAALTQGAVRCTGSPTHTAIWMLALSAAGQPLNIPVFVDQSPAGAGSSYTLQICLTSPEIPESAGGAPFGAKVLEATMSLNAVFTTPTAADVYVWDAFITPYVAGTGTPNAAGTVETRALVPVPTRATLATKYIAKTNTYRLQGAVQQASGSGTLAGIGRIKVFILRGLSPAKMHAGGATFTKANGTWKTAGHLKPRKTTFFQVHVKRGAVDVTSTACGAPRAPAGCVSATLAPFDIRSRIVRMRVK